MVSVSSTMSDHGDTANDDGSDSGSDDEELFAHINMEALKQRGKGMYTCPKGEKCDKGGVDKAGNIVHFDRNSSFAYVLSPCSLRPLAKIGACMPARQQCRNMVVRDLSANRLPPKQATL